MLPLAAVRCTADRADEEAVECVDIALAAGAFDEGAVFLVAERAEDVAEECVDFNFGAICAQSAQKKWCKNKPLPCSRPSLYL